MLSKKYYTFTQTKTRLYKATTVIACKQYQWRQTDLHLLKNYKKQQIDTTLKSIYKATLL
jgi:hypothetical protein